MTTPLAERLKRQIQHTGPMSVSEYMAACLFDPEHGYYTTREPFGRGGDFVTAPEISQMFGELIGIWIVSVWQEAGSPSEFAIAEIGPGRGTLMADMLRTFRKTGDIFPVCGRILMVETSSRLKEIQKTRLAAEAKDIEWISSVEELPATPLFVVGNELFDAIPIRQYVRSGDLWLERMIALDDADQLFFSVGAGLLGADQLPIGAAGQDDGTVFEIAPAREALAETIAAHIATHGGSALFFDYGHLQAGFGDTLQAVRDHKFDPVLASPGEADLTSHVDFSALSRAAQSSGAETACLKQGDFLLQLGLVERAGQLGSGLDNTAQKRIESEVQRLAGSDAMGDLFKAMTIFQPGQKPVPF